MCADVAMINSSSALGESVQLQKQFPGSAVAEQEEFELKRVDAGPAFEEEWLPVLLGGQEQALLLTRCLLCGSTGTEDARRLVERMSQEDVHCLKAKLSAWECTLKTSSGGYAPLLSIISRVELTPGTLAPLFQLPSREAQLQELPVDLHRLKGEVFQLTVASSVLKALPEWIGDFTRLYVLEISGPWCNNEMKELPESLGELQSLGTLKLQGLRALEALPAAISRLTSLEVLRIADCYRLKKLPKLDGLTALNSLEVVSESVDSQCRMELETREMKKLQMLWPKLEGLQNLHMVFPHIDEVSIQSRSRSLNTLEIDACEARELEFGAGLSCLERLKIYGCPMLEDLPASLAALPHLRRLEMSAYGGHVHSHENQSMTQLSAHIKELKELKELRIHMFMHLATLPDQMRALTELEKLEIDLCGLEALPASIVHLNQLQELSIIGCPIGDIPSLQTLTSLRRLFIFPLAEPEHRGRNGRVFQSLACALPHLQQLRELGLGVFEDGAGIDFEGELAICRALKAWPLPFVVDLVLPDFELFPAADDLLTLLQLSECWQDLELPGQAILWGNAEVIEYWSALREAPAAGGLFSLKAWPLPLLLDTSNEGVLGLNDCWQALGLPAEGAGWDDATILAHVDAQLLKQQHKVAAFASGMHARLGADSPALSLGELVLSMIAEEVLADGGWCDRWTRNLFREFQSAKNSNGALVVA